MVDTVYQPIVSDEDDQSETPSPRAELDIPDPAEFRRKAGVDDADHLTAEDATAQRRRRPDPESPESAYERPLVHIKAKGTEAISLNEAADAMRWGRGYKLGQELATSGLSREQVEAIAADAIERGERLDPLMPPPPVVEGIDEYGRKDDGPISVEEGAKQTTDWRQRLAEAQQQELQELAGEAAEHAQAEAQAQQPTEPQQPQQPQQQPDPVQTERAQLTAERQRIAYLKKMEGHEAAARLDYDQLVQAVANEFPSVRNGLPTPEQVADLARQDPARHQKLMMADQMLRERQQRIAALTQLRGQQERQQAAQEAAQLDKWAQAQNAIIDAELPELRDPKTAAQFKQDVAETMKAMGITQEHLNHHLFGPSLKSVEGQRLLADATRWRVAQQKAHQVRQSNLPQVIKPGTYRTADSGQSVRELQARLKGASGRRAIEIGAELTRARRASGG